MTRQFGITFGLSNTGPMISSITAAGPEVSRGKVQDLRRTITPDPEEVSIEGQIRAESVFSQLSVKSLGQEKASDFFTLKKPYFSNLWVGQDRNHNVSLGFVFNPKALMEKSVTFPALAMVTRRQYQELGLSTRRSQEITSLIKGMDVFKVKINKDKKTNAAFDRIDYEKDEKNKFIIAKYHPEILDTSYRPGLLQRMKLLEPGGRKEAFGDAELYSAIDIREETKDVLARDARIPINRMRAPAYQVPIDYTGAYKYGVDITFIDKTPEGMKEIFKALSKQLDSLKKVFNLMSIPNAQRSAMLENVTYNSRTGRLSDKISTIKIRAMLPLTLENGGLQSDQSFPGVEPSVPPEPYFNVDDIINKSYAVLQTTMTLLSSGQNNQNLISSNYVLPLTDRRNGTRSLEMLNRYIEVYEGYMTKILEKAKKAMPTFEIEGVAITNPRSSVGKKNKLVIKHEHIFEEIVDINKKASSGYEFILQENLFSERRFSAFPVIRTRNYYRRVGKNIDKFFDIRARNNQNVVADADMLLPYAPMQLLNDDAKNAYNPIPNSFSFMGPEAITIDYDRVGTDSLEEILPTPELFSAFLQLLNKKQLSSTVEGDLRPTPMLMPWVEAPVGFDNSLIQNIRHTTMLQGMLSTGGCEVRYTARQQEVEESSRRLGVDVFFGALPNDNLANISQRQMLNNNLGNEEQELAQPAAPPPGVSRLFTTLVADQLNIVQGLGKTDDMELDATSIAKITKQRNNRDYIDSRKLKQYMVEKPDLDEPVDLTDIPPQMQALLATQYAFERRPGADKRTLYDSLKFIPLQNEISDELSENREGRELNEKFLFPVRSDGEVKLAADVMKNWHKFPSFWFNYKTIASVEYLSGFSATNGQPNLRSPIWRRLTKDFVEGLTERDRIFCRMEIIGGKGQNQGIGKTDLFNLPTYNKYFFLNVDVVGQGEEEEEDTNDLGDDNFELEY